MFIAFLLAWFVVKVDTNGENDLENGICANFNNIGWSTLFLHSTFYSILRVKKFQKTPSEERWKEG